MLGYAAFSASAALRVRKGCYRSFSKTLVTSNLNKDTSVVENRESSVTRPARGEPRTTRKRKLALIIGYDGSTYHGWQRNVGVRAVVDDVEEALHKGGLISESNFGELSKTGFLVAARTDKGVCAAGNVISFKAELQRNDYADSPEGIHEVISSINENILPNHIRIFQASRVPSSFSARIHCDGRSYEYLLNKDALRGDDTSAFTNILKDFEGSHFFHNYTVGEPHRTPPPAQARRLIRSIDVVEYEKEWLRIRVQGQSFLLHMIRKMVACAILINRGIFASDSITRSFDRDCLLNIPPAPATGLFLDYCDFSNYNRKFSSESKLPISHLRVEDGREKFKREIIIPSIVSRTKTYNDMDLFFETAQRHA